MENKKENKDPKPEVKSPKVDKASLDQSIKQKQEDTKPGKTITK